MELNYILLKSEIDNPNAPLIAAVIGVAIVILIISGRKKQKARRKAAADLLQKKSDFIEKISLLSDSDLLNVLNHCKDYQKEAIEVALIEAKKRNIEFNYEKVKIEMEFGK